MTQPIPVNVTVNTNSVYTIAPQSPQATISFSTNNHKLIFSEDTEVNGSIEAESFMVKHLGESLDVLIEAMIGILIEKQIISGLEEFDEFVNSVKMLRRLNAEQP